MPFCEQSPEPASPEALAKALFARQPAPRPLSAHALRAIRAQSALRAARPAGALRMARWAAAAALLLLTTSVGLAVPGARLREAVAKAAVALVERIAGRPGTARSQAAPRADAADSPPAPTHHAPLPAIPSPPPPPPAALEPRAPQARVAPAREEPAPAGQLALEADSLRTLAALGDSPEAARATLRALQIHRARFPQGRAGRRDRLRRAAGRSALGRRAEALGLVTALAAEGAPHTALAVLHGELLASDGQCREAVARWAGPLPADPELAGRVLSGRAACFADLGDPSASRAAGEAYVRRFPRRPLRRRPAREPDLAPRPGVRAGVMSEGGSDDCCQVPRPRRSE